MTGLSGSPDWFADETFWEAFYPVMFTKERMEAAPAEVDAVRELAGVKQGPVLDLACGPGRHTVAFAQRGHQVTGVDLSGHLLEIAQRRAEETQVEVEFVREDGQSFVRPETFRLAVHLFTSFGFFEDREDDRRVLENIYRSLEEGGVVVLDLMGKEVLAGQFAAADVREHESGAVLFERRTILDG